MLAEAGEFKRLRPRWLFPTLRMQAFTEITVIMEFQYITYFGRALSAIFQSLKIKRNSPFWYLTSRGILRAQVIKAISSYAEIHAPNRYFSFPLHIC